MASIVAGDVWKYAVALAAAWIFARVRRRIIRLSQPSDGIEMRIVAYFAFAAFSLISLICGVVFAKPDAIHAAFDGVTSILKEIAAFMVAVGIPYLMWRQNRLQQQSKVNEVKIAEVKEQLGAQDQVAEVVKQQLAATNKVIVRKLDTLTVLTNGPVTAKVRKIAYFARRLADSTGDAGDIREAEIAERDLRVHLEKEKAAASIVTPNDTAEQTPLPPEAAATNSAKASV